MAKAVEKGDFKIEEIEKYYERVINVGNYQNVRIGIKLTGKTLNQLGNEEDKQKLADLSLDLLKTAGKIIENEAEIVKERFKKVEA